jgi:hypothetical protein
MPSTYSKIILLSFISTEQNNMHIRVLFTLALAGSYNVKASPLPATTSESSSSEYVAAITARLELQNDGILPFHSTVSTTEGKSDSS